MNLPQRFFQLCCISLFIFYTYAYSVSNDNLSVEKADPSIWDLLTDQPEVEKVLIEEPFTFPDVAHLSQWTAIETNAPLATSRPYLALDSLTQGETDQIFRYAIKFVSRHNVETVRLEGLSCQYRVYRVYAFNDPADKWTKALHPKWQRIIPHTQNHYTAVLFNAFCRTTGTQSIDKIKAQLKYDHSYDFVPS